MRCFSFVFFRNWRAEENLVVNNKDNLGTISLIAAPRKFDVLKTSIVAFEAKYLF